MWPGGVRHAVHLMGRDAGDDHRGVDQQNAEALAGLTLAELVRPGVPVVYGAFTSNVDLRSGAPAFGTPENVVATLAAGQLARRCGLPYRASNSNAANAVDAQAAYESMNALWSAVMGGAHLVYHGAGWMEGGLQASFEKLVVDVEMMQMMAEIVTRRRSTTSRRCWRRSPGAAGRAFLRGGSCPRALSQRLLRAAGVGLAQPWGLGEAGSPTAIDRPQIWLSAVAARRRSWRRAGNRCLCGGTQRRRWRRARAAGRVPVQGLWRSARRCGHGLDKRVLGDRQTKPDMAGPRGTEHFAGHDRDVGLLEKGQGKGFAAEPGRADVGEDEHAAFRHAGADSLAVFQHRHDQAGAAFIGAAHRLDLGKFAAKGKGGGVLDEGLGAEQHHLGYCLHAGREFGRSDRPTGAVAGHGV
jgi:hypothetical protein